MQRFRRIYYEALTLFGDVTRTNPDKYGYSTAFSSKMASFEIMYREVVKKVKNLESVMKGEESEHKVAFPGTTRARYEATAFYEAYLNSFYSLLQIIAKFTPLFYPKSKIKIPYRNFGQQRNFFINEHPELDPKFSSYLRSNSTWYKTLKNNRHAVTHNLSAFLGFEKEGTVTVIDYPDMRKKEFDWFGEKKIRQIKKYLDQSFNDLVDFLEFYARYFRKRVPESDKTKFIVRSVLETNTKK